MRAKQVPNWLMLAIIGAALALLWVAMDRHIRRICVRIVRDAVEVLDIGS